MTLYDPKSNDYLYSCSYFCPGFTPDEAIKSFVDTLMSQYIKNVKELSRKELDVCYGPEKVDIWGDGSDNLFIYIHGGFWQEGCKEGATSIVQPLVENNIQVATVGYTLASKIPLKDTIKQIEECILFLHNKYPSSKIILSGHSAGAHLAVKVCEEKNIGKIVDKLVLYSGIYKLNDLVGTYIGNGINLTMEDAIECSINIDKIKENFKGKMILFAGGFESPKMKQQSNHLAHELNVPYHVC
uniref:Abhydrolase_3 domain-containing protein n=1 Tax=Parastrongyloides trichosuri TaxID=131310 RepID=A0A0N4ZK74_PARTI